MSPVLGPCSSKSDVWIKSGTAVGDNKFITELAKDVSGVAGRLLALFISYLKDNPEGFCNDCLLLKVAFLDVLMGAIANMLKVEIISAKTIVDKCTLLPLRLMV